MFVTVKMALLDKIAKRISMNVGQALVTMAEPVSIRSQTSIVLVHQDSEVNRDNSFVVMIK